MKVDLSVSWELQTCALTEAIRPAPPRNGFAVIGTTKGASDTRDARDPKRSFVRFVVDNNSSRAQALPQSR